MSIKLWKLHYVILETKGGGINNIYLNHSKCNTLLVVYESYELIFMVNANSNANNLKPYEFAFVSGPM